jgi:hypothetical protein
METDLQKQGQVTFHREKKRHIWQKDFSPPEREEKSFSSPSLSTVFS